MKDDDCVTFLQWALPRMGLYWPGFRRVRGLVCKRIDRRRRALGIDTVAGYRDLLHDNAVEWDALRALCAIPISRFYRDRGVFAALEHVVLPGLAAAARARPEHTLTCWSVGCASGEEAYTLSIVWQLQFAARFPAVALRILGSDVDPVLLARAAAGCYSSSSLSELPLGLQAQAFEARARRHCIREKFRAGVVFEQRDVRDSIPDARFDLVLCRNVVLTYFQPELQRSVLHRIIATLRVGGALVVGIHESLPAGTEGLALWPGMRCIFKRGTLASGTR